MNGRGASLVARRGGWTDGRNRAVDPKTRHAGEYEGYELHDPLGRRVGRVETLFADRDGKPRYVRAKLGPFGLLGSFLIPVRRADVDEERRTVSLG